ncbi:MAG: hypothetical protein OES24_05380 [Acidimicrobiia bacterium]|nr:hypothetical protein [Acidimicrobiia bacterium]
MAIHVLSTSMNRFKSVNRWLFAIVVSVVVLSACGDSGSNAEADDGAAPISNTESEATETTEPESTTTSNGGGGEEATSTTEAEAGTGDAPDLERLHGAIDATVARNSARFLLDVTQTLPVTAPNQASMRRTGSFDDQEAAGTGTQVFIGELGALNDLPGYAGEELEYRLVDGTYWLLNPLSDPPSWVGYDLADFAQLTAGDPTVSINGDLYLATVGQAITSITDMVEFDDGSEGWAVRVTADDLLPLVVTAGVQQRLVADGLEPTDLEADVSLAVDPDGMVVGLIADLNEWWQAVIDQTDVSGNAPVGMVLQFQIGDFDVTVEADTPCADPEEFVEPDAPTALICRG